MLWPAQIIAQLPDTSESYMLRKILGRLVAAVIQPFVVPAALESKECHFRAELKHRPNLNEMLFLEKHYSGSPRSKQRMAVLVRNYLHDELRIKSLLPHDDLAENFPDIAFQEIVLDLCELTETNTDDLDISEIAPTSDGLVDFLLNEKRKSTSIHSGPKFSPPT